MVVPRHRISKSWYRFPVRRGEAKPQVAGRCEGSTEVTGRDQRLPQGASSFIRMSRVHGDGTHADSETSEEISVGEAGETEKKEEA